MKMIKMLAWAGVGVLTLLACSNSPVEEVLESDCPFQQAKDTEVSKGNEKGFKISGDLRLKLGKLISELKKPGIPGPELGASIELLDIVKNSSSEKTYWGSEKVETFNLFNLTLCSFYSLSQDTSLTPKEREEWAGFMNDVARNLICLLNPSAPCPISGGPLPPPPPPPPPPPKETRLITFAIPGMMENAEVLLDSKPISPVASLPNFLKVKVPVQRSGHEIILKTKDRKCTLRFQDPSSSTPLLITNCKAI